MNNNNRKKIMIPSFAIERKTKALNYSLWGFVGLISMFTVELGVIIFHEMLCSVFKISSTFIRDNLTVVGLVTVIGFAFLFASGYYSFLQKVLKAYVIEDDKITVGRIVSSAKVNGRDLALEASFTAFTAANITNGSRVSQIQGIQNTFKIIQMIILNTTEGYADTYFDTAIYKKKTYRNPTLIKESKYAFVYLCDGNKKVKVSKMYTGMNLGSRYHESTKETSVLKRVLLKSLLVFLLFSALSAADLTIGVMKNDDNLASIAVTNEEISSRLDSLGYTGKEVNEKCCIYEKQVSQDRTSQVKVSFSPRGEVADVEFDLYYITTSENIADEIEYIVKLTNADFTEKEIQNFISAVKDTVNGDYSYSTLGEIRLGTSSGHAQVHN